MTRFNNREQHISPNKYFGEWANQGIEGLKKDFSSDLDGISDQDILFAYYSDGGCCDWDAYVLFRRDGTLYEVIGGHCSCYGLEGQWEPVETDMLLIAKRLDRVINPGEDYETAKGYLRSIVGYLQ